MRAVKGDTIGTTDGRYGVVECDEGGTLLVKGFLEDGSEVFEVTQAQVASIV